MGTLFSMILDIEIRHATKNQKGLVDVLTLMYRELAKNGKQYYLSDVIKYVNRVASKDLTMLFDNYVTGTNSLNVNHYLSKGGLTLNTFYDDAYISLDEDADALGAEIGREILGK